MGITPFLISSLVGAGLMYFFDPQAGKRRRALLRDQWVKFQHTATDRVPDRVENLVEDAANRVRGTVAEAKRRTETQDADDETLVARVRSEMGRYVSHPRAVEVTANGGVVTLTGDILTEEVQPFIETVNSIPGVQQVDNRLQAHAEAGNMPNLQGGKTRTELR